MLGLGIGTARHHLKRVFEKTGVHSQVKLVALLRGFVNPGA
jgi:DNA-binding CsgD family transcriptional regulator